MCLFNIYKLKMKTFKIVFLTILFVLSLVQNSVPDPTSFTQCYFERIRTCKTLAEELCTFFIQHVQFNIKIPE